MRSGIVNLGEALSCLWSDLGFAENEKVKASKNMRQNKQLFARFSARRFNRQDEQGDGQYQTRLRRNPADNQRYLELRTNLRNTIRVARTIQSFQPFYDTYTKP